MKTIGFAIDLGLEAPNALEDDGRSFSDSGLNEFLEAIKQDFAEGMISVVNEAQILPKKLRFEGRITVTGFSRKKD